MKNAKSLIQLSNSLLGVAFTNHLIKSTFFNQFCAGENENDIIPIIEDLKSKRIGAILDYAAEGEADAPQSASQELKTASAVTKTEEIALDNFSPVVTSISDQKRPYSTNVTDRPLRQLLNGISSTDMAEEHEFDKNLRLSMKGVSAAKISGGFVAIKVSALTCPNLLQRVSEVLNGHRRRFRAFVAGNIATDQLSSMNISKNGITYECQFQPNSTFRYCSMDAVFPVLEFLHSPLDENSSSNMITLTPTKNPYFLGSIRIDQFIAGMQEQRSELIYDTLYRPEVLEILFQAMDFTQSGYVDYLSWSDFSSLLALGEEEALQPLLDKLREVTSLPNEELLHSLNSMFSQGPSNDPVPSLSRVDRARWQNMLLRAQDLTKHAIANRVAIMIDAEHTFVQPAIDWTVTQMQRQFNRVIHPSAPFQYPEVAHLSATFGNSTPDFPKYPYLDPSFVTRVNQRRENPSPSAPFPVVFNTLQAYLRDSASRLLLSIARAEKEGFLTGNKLVRGAYMIQERQRSRKLGYNDPIFPCKDVTDANYNACMQALLSEVEKNTGEIVIASHNEQSISECIKLMEQKKIDSSMGVSFGQLLGMCDYITMQLGQKGYNAFKYVPYGPVQEVIPYLIRRAEENGDIVTGGAGKETTLLAQEIKRRLWSH